MTYLMSARERDLTHLVLDGETSKDLLMLLYFISDHVRVVEILQWLYKNKVIGKTLIYEMKFKHRNSVINTTAWIIKHLDYDIEKRQIIAGKHWRG